jgi:hypothetical protein
VAASATLIAMVFASVAVTPNAIAPFTKLRRDIRPNWRFSTRFLASFSLETLIFHHSSIVLAIDLIAELATQYIRI